MAVTFMINETHEMFPLIVQSLQNDLQSRNEYHQVLHPSPNRFQSKRNAFQTKHKPFHNLINN